MKLLLKRIALKPTYTIGWLYIDGQKVCDTIEDAVRDLNKNGQFDNGEKKVYAETAIPYGTYDITLKIQSPKYKDRAQYKFCDGYLPRLLNVPEFDVNDPFTLQQDTTGLSEKEIQDLLNQMWRNACINDTYEPGSTFKIITMSAGLSEGVVSPNDSFFCPGYKIVEDRRIHCHKRTGHGAENFVQGAQNSCNPVFIEVGLRLGVEKFCDYFRKFGLMEKTGIDLPGEASTIMHKEENIGEVELATMAFGQSFQITPVQLATTVSSIINGGNRITPHFGISVESADGTQINTLEYPVETGILSEETSKTVRSVLEKVVSQGSGKNAGIEGYSIGGKTATSQTLPRGSGRYISSFLGFAPAENPTVLGLCIIHNPQGMYYGGIIAAPVIRSIFENILPYLGIEKTAQEETRQGGKSALD